MKVSTQTCTLPQQFGIPRYAIHQHTSHDDLEHFLIYDTAKRKFRFYIIPSLEIEKPFKIKDIMKHETQDIMTATEYFKNRYNFYECNFISD